jgi:threonine synthase
MRFVTTRGEAPAVSFKAALFEGLAPDGGLYVPERSRGLWDRLPAGRTLTGDAALRSPGRSTRPFEAVIAAALDFPIPLVEVAPRSTRSSCFTVRRWRSKTSARA